MRVSVCLGAILILERIPGFPFRPFYSQEQNSRNIFRNIFRNIPNERALSHKIGQGFWEVGCITPPNISSSKSPPRWASWNFSTASTETVQYVQATHCVQWSFPVAIYNKWTRFRWLHVIIIEIAIHDDWIVKIVRQCLGSKMVLNYSIVMWRVCANRIWLRFKVLFYFPDEQRLGEQAVKGSERHFFKTVDWSCRLVASVAACVLLSGGYRE